MTANRTLGGIAPSIILACIALPAHNAGAAMAGSDQQSWQFDETTTGNDIHWVSTTSVNSNALQYDGQYEIQLVEVMVSWEGIPFGPFDVTDELGDDATGGSVINGPAPILLLNDTVIFPEPPEPTTFAADLVIGLNADGFGYFDATNVVLGTTEVDLGFPIGVVTVQIESVRIAGQVTVTAIGEIVPGDLNNDGTVDGADLALLLGAWGTCPDIGLCPADLNESGNVDGTDLAVLLGNWG